MKAVPPLVLAHVVVGLAFRGWHVGTAEEAVSGGWPGLGVGVITDLAWAVLVVGGFARLSARLGERAVPWLAATVLAAALAMLMVNLQAVAIVGFPLDLFALSYVRELGNVGFMESVAVEAPVALLTIQAVVLAGSLGLAARREPWPSAAPAPGARVLGGAAAVVVALTGLAKWTPDLVFVARSDGLSWSVDQVLRPGLRVPADSRAAALTLRPPLPPDETFAGDAFPLMRGDPAHPCPTGDGCVSLVPDTAPDVVILQMESLPAWVLPVAGGVGEDLVAPVLTRVAGRADAWVHADFESNATQTAPGLAALLCSVWPHHGLMLTRLRPPLRCLPRILAEAGYQTHLVLGGDPAFDHQAHFGELIGFENVEAMGDIFRAAGREVRQGPWGAADELLFAHVGRLLESPADRPRLVVAQTIGNHHPFEVPTPGDRDPEHPVHGMSGGDVRSTSAYADWSLGPLVQTLDRMGKTGRRTLVVITGDNGHGRPGSSRVEFPFAALYRANVHTPLVVWAPGAPQLVKPLRAVGAPALASTVDILPTLLGLLGVRTTHASVGVDLTRQAPPSSLATGPSSGGLIRYRTPRGSVQIRLFPAATALHGPDDPDETISIGARHPELLERLSYDAMVRVGAMKHLVETRRIWPEAGWGEPR